jgi:Kef-type K+ transport system membrane component KefB
MPDVSFTNLLIIMVIAVLAPLLIGYAPRLRVPAVVLEIIAGVIGQTTIAASTIADFTAIVLLTLFFSTSGGSTGSKLLLLGVFAGLVAVLALVLTRAGRSMHLGSVLVRLQDTTAEIRVRFAVLLLIAFVALAEQFGLETILGAFLAGAVVSLIDRDSSTHPPLPDQVRDQRT